MLKGLPGRPIFFIEEVIATRKINSCSVPFFEPPSADRIESCFQFENINKEG